VSYHFPPSQEAGAKRWHKFSAFVSERGWALDVIALDPAALCARDEAQLKELPVGVRLFGIAQPPLLRERLEHVAWRLVYRTLRPLLVPRRVDSLSRLEVRWLPRQPRHVLRAYFAWMDYAQAAAWSAAAVATGLACSAKTRPIAVISCGPPHMATHEAARRLSIATGVPYVMDLRDPWSLAERLPEELASPLWWRLAARHEARAVAQASLIVANTELVRAALQRRYPAARDRVISVLNGYDEESLPTPRRGRRFTVAYAGSIYIDRDPRPLLRAAAQVIRERRLSPEDFGIDFMGNVSAYEGQTLDTIAAEEGLAGYIRLFPPRTRQDALQFQADAHLLVSLPQDNKLAIPSKLYEYIRCSAWVLALAEPESASALMLRGTAADVVSARDTHAIAAVLRRRYDQHAGGAIPVPVGLDARFSRREQARRLLDAIAGLGTRAQ
jgi:hypothetical protein